MRGDVEIDVPERIAFVGCDLAVAQNAVVQDRQGASVLVADILGEALIGDLVEPVDFMTRLYSLKVSSYSRRSPRAAWWKGMWDSSSSKSSGTKKRFPYAMAMAWSAALFSASPAPTRSLVAFRLVVVSIPWYWAFSLSRAVFHRS